MKATPLYLGIDFGTTNSSVAFVYGDPRHSTAQSIPVRPVSITMDEENNITAERMPTLLSTRFNDKRAKGFAKGWDVLRIFGKRKKAPLLRRGRDLFESVKSDLGSHRIYMIAASPECNTPHKVAASIMGALLEEAVRKLPSFKLNEVRTVITVPASLNAEARRGTREAAVAAGLNADLIELIDEPIAALLHLLNEHTATAILSANKPRTVLVFDYGGGTLDLCLVKCSFNLDAPNGLRAETLAISKYRRNGGNDVDRAIMRDVIWPQVEKQIGRERGDLPGDARQAIEDTLTSTLARKLKEKLCNKIARLVKEGDDYSRLQADLSETVTTEGDFFDESLQTAIRGRFKITKAQFDRIMAPFLFVPPDESDFSDDGASCSLVAPIRDCLDKAGLAPEDLDVLVLHGGSCRNPYVGRHLRKLLADRTSLFGRTTILETPNLDTSVACGAALACYWKHERGVELIKPVTAEDVGIITLGGEAVCLVKSGAPLPFPAEGVHEHPADFYVAQNDQKELIVPFYTGRTRRDPRLSGVVKVPLPEGVRRADVVKLKLCIDRDKILHWWYRVGAGGFVAAAPLNDPWTPSQLEPPDRRLLAFRRNLEERFNTSQNLPDWMLLEDANLSRLAGDLDEAEVLLLDFVATRTLTAQSANLLSIVYGSLGRRQEELHYAEKAATLGPAHAILVGNYGCVLANAGRTDEAVAQMRLALGMNPNLEYLYSRLGQICRRKGDEEGALREFRQAIRVVERKSQGEPACATFWRELADIYHKVGDYEQASIARSRLQDAELNELYEGDHRKRIAGPDTGFLTTTN